MGPLTSSFAGAIFQRCFRALLNWLWVKFRTLKLIHEQALRGGGCNFGVVTSMTIKVFDIPKWLAGMIVFPIHEAKQVLKGYQEILDEDLPNPFGGDLGFMNFPGAGHVLAVIFSWASGDFDAGLKYAEKIKGLGSVAMDTVAPCET